MLRIIEVNQTSPTQEDKEIDKISISLNRQKPIKVEDIAFTMPFIYSINKLNQNHKDEFDYFRLIKRGETSSNSNEYNLVQFARAAKAYLAQEPGKAMSQGARTLLKPTYKDETTLFSDDAIFKQDIISEEGENYELFKKYYTPINLAIKLERYYSSFAKSSNECDSLRRAILNYGKWHFVAYIIYILNNNDLSDFSNLKVNESKLTTNIDQYISRYVELFSKVVSTNTKYTSLSTNDFKGTDLYNYFRNYPTITGALEDINILIKDFSEYINTLLV